MTITAMRTVVVGGPCPPGSGGAHPKAEQG
jgi:hypothetical protein